MRTDKLIDAALVAFGAALPLSLAATNASLALLSAGLLTALADPAARADALGRLGRAARTPLFAALAAYAAASAVAGLGGIDRAHSFSLLPKDLHKLWVAAAFGAALDPRRRVLFLRALVAGAAAAALIGLAQTAAMVSAMALHHGSPTIVDLARANLRGRGFMHPVSYGECLGLVFLGLILKDDAAFSLGLRRKAAALVGAAILCNQTRAVILALAAGVFAVAVVKPKWRKAALAGIVATAAVIVLWSALPTGRSLADLLTFKGSQSARLTLWSVAWRMFRDHPWTGVGPGNYRAAFPAYFAGILDGERAWGNAHDLWLHQAAERGLVGLAALGAVGLALARGVILGLRRTDDVWPLWALSALVAFTVMNLTETAFQTEQVATLFLALMLLPDAVPRAEIL